MKQGYVIDASVVLRSILPSEQTTNVHLHLQTLLKLTPKRTEIFSTALFMLEVANGLRFHWADPQLSQTSIARIKGLPIRIISLTNEQVEDALMLSYQLKTTVYDTCYHLLAKFLNATFITCDRRYFEKAKRLGNIELW